MYADVSFPISSFQVFSYKIPENLATAASVGSTVNAPLGKRMVSGIIVRCYSESKYTGKIKEITSIEQGKPILDGQLWKLITWLSSYYDTPIGLAAKAVLPSKLSTSYEPKKQNFARVLHSQNEKNIKGSTQIKVFNFLKSQNLAVPFSALKIFSPNPSSICNSLEKKGLIEIIQKPVIPNIYETSLESEPKEINLTSDQQNAISSICNSLDQNIFDPFLLHGVTGSGKTEVFIEAAKHAMNQNKSVVVLLPEISTTPQIAGRFKSVFGDSVAVWHSKLSKSSRAWIWKKICNGDFKIIVGARSAIFTPLKNLGLIIVDEEQENAYKQTSSSPKYHAKEVALMRGKISKATVILSSATPSIETYYNYKSDKFKYLELPKRFGNAKLPEVHLVNMIDENKAAENYDTIFSQLLLDKIEDRIKKNEQVILLHNRRGFAPILRCDDCGEISKCPHCQLSLTFHKTDNVLKCHFCNFTKPPAGKCANCSSFNGRLSGTGTQKIEDELAKLFPDAIIDRLDLDAAPTAQKIFHALNKFSKNEIHILVGTQMIAKGLDFPNATLVGIINADTGLFLPDFRSGEKVFQLIYQAAGRAGRGSVPGEVVVQTYNSDNEIINDAVNFDMVGYYEKCLAERSDLNYPPFSWLVKIEIRGKNKRYVSHAIETLNNNIPSLPTGIEKLGPSPCYREKLKDQYRMQIVLKSNKKHDSSGSRVHRIYKQAIKKSQLMKNTRSKIIVDINPISLL
tara:strand:- start:86 stop:2302 length:2217 start_codon:yes stop_codon:yes gene_type:complete